MNERDLIIEEMRVTLAAYGRGEITEQEANASVRALTDALNEVTRRMRS